MAFYALWKWFSPWSKKKYPDMIYWYREYVLKSPEQRALEQAQRQEEIEVLKKKLHFLPVTEQKNVPQTKLNTKA